MWQGLISILRTDPASGWVAAVLALEERRLALRGLIGIHITYFYLVYGLHNEFPVFKRST